MYYRYSYKYIIGLFIIGSGLDCLLKIIMGSIPDNYMILKNVGSFISSVFIYFYVVYSFCYRLHVSDTGMSEISNVFNSPVFYYIFGSPKTVKVLDHREYAWEKIKKVEADNHWFFPGINVSFLVDGKLKSFKISPFLDEVQTIHRKINEKVEPYFIDDEARKIID